MAEKALNDHLKRLGASELLRATVLLWNDRLGSAHKIAQAIENADGSYVHAIIHRREPDYSNSRYWFHRVGNHPCFDELVQRAEQLLKSHAALRAKIIPNGAWDPFAFVDACERRLSSESEQLRAIQATELQILAEYFSGSS